MLGVMSSLLQEIISVYPLLNPSQLTAAASNRVCNALALLQCVASHSETRGLFLGGRHHDRYPDGKGLTSKPSSYTPLPLSFPQHHFKEQAIRISTAYVAGSHRSLGQKRQLRSHQFPANNRNHTSVLANNGDGLGA